jgi:membrane fusion protein (multidrug efflux system)
MSSRLKNALIIPQEATFDVLDKKFVYVVDKNNTVRAQEITLGIELPHLYTVLSGLNLDDKILIEGLRKVKNNDKIKTKFLPIQTVLGELGHLHAE